MKSDNHLNKFFIIQMIVLNIITVGLIIRELINLNEIRKVEQFINSNQSILTNQYDETSLDSLNLKYQNIKANISSENTLGGLINFLEIKTEQYNLKIKETKVIYATEEEISYEITVEGNINSIYNFVFDIEEDKNLKMITNTSMSFINNVPNVKISIVNKKLWLKRFLPPF